MAIVGAGISGLSVAFELLERDRAGGAETCSVTLFEADGRAGGNIRTEEIEGYRVEWAANGFLDNAPETLRLVERLGLSGRLAPADPAAARRYIYRGGRLHLLPRSPLAFLASPILSLRGRLRVLAEPFVPGAPPDHDESVFDFAARRIGREAASVLIDSMVSGVFAGDARRLSLASAFPIMRAMETEHGSLVRAMITKQRAARRARRASKESSASGASADRDARLGDPSDVARRGGPAGPAGHLTSFLGGMEELPRALAARLGVRIRLGARVEEIATSSRGSGGASRAMSTAPSKVPNERMSPADPPRGAVPAFDRFALRLASGETLSFDAVLLACSPIAASRLIASLDAELSSYLAAIPSAPVAVVALGFRTSDIESPPDGFGLLVPRAEGVRPLGVLFDSNLFPGRAPSGHLLLRVLIGGACDPDAVALDDGALLGLSRDLLRRALGIGAPPVFTRVIRHHIGIPQYVLGHGDRLHAIDRRLASHAGLYLSGNGYGGVSINSCVGEARRVASAILGGSHVTS